MKQLKLYFFTATLLVTTGLYARKYQNPKLSPLDMPKVSFKLAPILLVPKVQAGRFIASISMTEKSRLVPAPEDEYKGSSNIIYYSSYELPGEARSEVEILSYRSSRTPASIDHYHWEMPAWEK